MQQGAQLAGELPWEREESVRNTAPRSAMTDGQETEAGKQRGTFWFVSLEGFVHIFTLRGCLEVLLGAWIPMYP